MTAPRHAALGGIGPEAADLLAERVHSQREQLFNVDSILTVCHNALATKYQVTDPEYMAPALLAASRIVNIAAGELGVIVEILKRDPRQLDTQQPPPKQRGAKNSRMRRRSRRT
jgi:hypothetical protein